MKRLWAALILLAAILAGSFFHARALEDFTGEVSALLDLAGQAAKAERWEDAAALTRRAEGLWTGHETVLHVLLRHGDTDAVLADFREAGALLAAEDAGGYAAAVARLTARLELLCRGEQLTVENLF